VKAAKAKTFAAPWTNEATAGIVARLWPTLEDFANASEADVRADWPRLQSAWTLTRGALDRIIAGQPPWSGHGRTPPLLLYIRGGRVDWDLAQPEPPETARGADEWASLWAFVTMLLWHKKHRGRLLRCAECGRYSLARAAKAAKAAKQTDRNRFCKGGQCRRAWYARRAKTPEGRANAAARQRQHDRNHGGTIAGARGSGSR
jgi:hypothetical protein